MKTATMKITRQEFETILSALFLLQNADQVLEKKGLTIRGYQKNEEFDLLHGDLLEGLVQKLITTKVAPSCIECGWDATCAFGSTANSYCDECAELREGAWAKPQPRARPAMLTKLTRRKK